MVFTTSDAHSSSGGAYRVNRSPAVLRGLDEICRYVGCSDKTLMKYIRAESFPASKIGGIWCSDKEAVDTWRYAALHQK